MSADSPGSVQGALGAAPLDVLIVGGGLAGACAGALLQRASLGRGRALSVAVLDHTLPKAPAADTALDARVSALSRASEHILTHAGAWEQIAGARIEPYERMRVWHHSVAPGSGGELIFDAADAGEPNLGHIAENRLVQAAAVEAFERAGGRLILGELAALRVHDSHIEAETSAGALNARLVVGADGARSAVREAIGLTVESRSYGQTAIVANVSTGRAHEHTAYQRFLGDGTLALLPLADGTSSIVWSADTQAAKPLLASSNAQFEAALRRQSADVLGELRLVSERVSFPLTRQSAHRYTARRCALIGDAAHVVHPLAGQGANLGLLDAAALAEVVGDATRAGEDPGAERPLRRYERWRKSETELMAVAIEGFDRFLAHGSGPLARIAQHGLGWVNRSREAKRIFIARALGLAGELPRTARADAETPA
jgi:ubiquinone biosynthesis UbiH/UbiF/VisC/COQ6 family hydroxylase